MFSIILPGKIERVANAAMGGKSLIRQSVELAVMCVALYALVEPRGVEAVKPCAEFCQLRSGQAFNGFFDVFDVAHKWRLAAFE